MSLDEEYYPEYSFCSCGHSCLDGKQCCSCKKPLPTAEIKSTEVKLTNQKCVSCNAETPKLTSEEALSLMSQIPGWELRLDNSTNAILYEAIPTHCLVKEFKFKKFRQAIAFVNQIAALAEEQRHHPDIEIKYSRVTLKLNTHAIKGLSKNDFVMAAKISEMKLND